MAPAHSCPAAKTRQQPVPLPTTASKPPLSVSQSVSHRFTPHPLLHAAAAFTQQDRVLGCDARARHGGLQPPHQITISYQTSTSTSTHTHTHTHTHLFTKHPRCSSKLPPYQPTPLDAACSQHTLKPRAQLPVMWSASRAGKQHHSQNREAARVCRAAAAFADDNNNIGRGTTVDAATTSEPRSQDKKQQPFRHQQLFSMLHQHASGKTLPQESSVWHLN
jgi:hypothetical protein